VDREESRPEGETAIKSALIRGALLAVMLGIAAACVALDLRFPGPVVVLGASFGATVGLGAAPLAFIQRRIRRPLHVVALSTLCMYAVLAVAILQGFYAWGLLMNDLSVTQGLESLRSNLVSTNSVLGLVTLTPVERLVVGVAILALCVFPWAVVSALRVRGVHLAWQVFVSAASSFLVVMILGLQKHHDPVIVFVTGCLAWPVLVLLYELAEFGEHKLLRGRDPCPATETGGPRAPEVGWKTPVAILLALVLPVSCGSFLRTKWYNDAHNKVARHMIREHFEALAEACPRGFGRTGQGEYGVFEPGSGLILAKAFALAPRRVSTIPKDDGAALLQDASDGALIDMWGNPIRYCCPGPIHKNGWDLISFGPNGVYEEGDGDDIVVGRDLPGGIAAVESSGQ